MVINDPIVDEALQLITRMGESLKASIDATLNEGTHVDRMSVRTGTECAHAYRRLLSLAATYSGQESFEGADEIIQEGVGLWETMLRQCVDSGMNFEDVLDEQCRDFLCVFEEASGWRPDVTESDDSETKISLEEKAKLRIKSYEEDGLGRYKHVLTHEFVGNNKRHAAALGRAHLKNDEFLAATGFEGEGKLTWDKGTVKLCAAKEWVGEQGVRFMDDTSSESVGVRPAQDQRPVYPPPIS